MVAWRGVAVAMILLAGCTAMAPAGPRAAPVDSIGFQLNSWGYPLEGFTIASDGTGEFRKAPQLRAEPRITRFNAGRAGFERRRGDRKRCAGAPPSASTSAAGAPRCRP